MTNQRKVVNELQDMIDEHKYDEDEDDEDEDDEEEEKSMWGWS